MTFSTSTVSNHDYPSFGLSLILLFFLILHFFFNMLFHISTFNNTTHLIACYPGISDPTIMYLTSFLNLKHHHIFPSGIPIPLGIWEVMAYINFYFFIITIKSIRKIEQLKL